MKRLSAALARSVAAPFVALFFAPLPGATVFA